LESVELDAGASGSATFELLNAPTAGSELAGGAKQELQVRFNPSSVALFESRLLIVSGSPSLEPVLPYSGSVRRVWRAKTSHSCRLC
jgi:hypothetical protein